MALYGTFLYGSGIYYTGSGTDKLLDLDFYRTDTDSLYVFHWMFNQAFISPLLAGLDYQLQLDTDPNFSAPQIYETVTETANIIPSGYSLSGAYATINISAGETLSLNINNDGVQTVILSLHITGNDIASDIQTTVRALTANNPANQTAYNNFTATFSGGPFDTYTLTSGTTGISSTVVVTGGTAAPALRLGLANGGYEVRGNSTILKQAARRVLIVHDGTTIFSDVSASTNTPGPEQYIVSIATNQVTFNDVDLPDAITLIYVPATSEDIIQFQRGNVAKGFTVNVFPRIDSARLTFYARVRVKSAITYGPFSDITTVQTLADVTKESADRLLQALPDQHVYPVDESFKPLADRTKNISKVYWGYATELDRFFLEKENTIRDPRQARTRDPRLFGIIGSRFKYPKPSGMEFVDYRVVVSNAKEAALDGGTYNAVKLVGRAFTGVDPTITPLSQDFNFITADETLTIENIVVSLVPAYTATLSSAVRIDPIIPGSTISGPLTTVTESHTIPNPSGPYTIALTNPPANIPSIPLYTFTNGTPAVLEFSVNYATGVLTFNAANAGTPVNITYVPHYNLSGTTLFINIDGDGVQMITLVGPFTSKTEIAAAIQSTVRALIAFTPSNQPSYDNFLTIYDSATDKFTLISGNQHPTSASSVIVTAGTAAPLLKLRLSDGATQTNGLAYQTPPAPPASGFFRNNIDTGDGSLLTFEGIAQAGKTHTVLYKKKSTIFTYLPHTTTESLTVSVVTPYIVTLLNPPANIPAISGFTYTTGAPAVGQFTVDFATGIITFNAANAGASVSVSYVSTVPLPPTLFSTVEAGFGIKIILNNPGGFILDRTNIAFLLRQILPAHTKFILV